jgi:hypothetical protein
VATAANHKPGLGGASVSPTDISEKGLESIIVRHMTGLDGFAIAPDSVTEKPEVGARAISPVVQRTLTALMLSTSLSSLPSSAPLSPTPSRSWH